MNPRAFAPARVIDLGTKEYGEVWKMQADMVAARQCDEIVDTLLLVEHPHVITLGRGSHRENLIAPGDVPIFEVERGGDVTYHGPGQLVGYLIFQLRDGERDLHLFLRRMEQALVLTLDDFGIAAAKAVGQTGVWTGDGARKVASMGIAVKRWVTMHGFALNVSTDLARFSVIAPCGFDAGVMASMQSLTGQGSSITDVKQRLIVHLGAVFGRDFTPGGV